MISQKNQHPLFSFMRTLRSHIVRHTKESFEIFGPAVPQHPPVSTTPTFVRVPFDTRRRIKNRYCRGHHSHEEHERMMNFVHDHMRKSMGNSYMYSRQGGFSLANFKKFRKIRQANIRACEQAMLQYKVLCKKSQPLLIKRLSLFPVVLQRGSTSAVSQFVRVVFRQQPTSFSKGFVGRNVLDTHTQHGLGLGSGLGRVPLLAPLFSTRPPAYARHFSSTSVLAASLKSAVFSDMRRTASDNTEAPTKTYTTVPQTGSYVHFDIEPKFSISEETQLSEDVVETLAHELNAYADRLKRLAGELESLASMGHLPISLEQGKALNVFFANCEPDRLDQILTGAEVTEGTIRCQPTPYANAHMGINDVDGEATHPLFDFEHTQSSAELSFSMSRSWLSTASSHGFVLEQRPECDGMSEAESGLLSSMPSLTDASSGETVSEVQSVLYA
ncbi:hypothetical protein DV113_004079 [Geotrichum candidum]|nr:hypothetical protein DV113_004079 [Geotrichum candidum]KAI8132879.1 hypothetical protein DUD61_003470 [Geotrichum candidum]